MYVTRPPAHRASPASLVHTVCRGKQGGRAEATPPPRTGVGVLLGSCDSGAIIHVICVYVKSLS